ncbi:glucosamine inositolphosphorylceramide transferase family protein [Methylobacterium sp. Leaf118]|uniref:glucosamine inositolphosphorylceramide transferase family protein n=1 Tax=Methylobacterium sp. Leaf118 TaxID=2876562 RepID=UPI001E4846CA|nr:formyl transferase [Methylobacterium sp. Leaf118]
MRDDRPRHGRLRLRLDGPRARRWHRLLLDRLVAEGFTVDLDGRPGPGALPGNAALLFRLEAMLGRLPLDGPAATLPPGVLDAVPPSAAPPDLILDLCGDADGRSVWRLAYDGACGEAGLFAALMDGRSPIATLSEGDRPIAAARLGTESPGLVLAAFEDGLMRTITLVAAALAGARPALPVAERPAPRPPARLGARALRLVARQVVRRLYHLCYRAPHWRVGWRPLDGPDLIDRRAHPEAGWRRLPDDGLRFYADPFPLDARGRTILFVEEYRHASGKALISAVPFGPDGPEGVPEPVLEEPWHLSYPFVFERDGHVWMVPESSANGTVDLYRAERFPGGWVREATLLAGVTASDATLLEEGGRWWLFATVRDGATARDPHGAFSDALFLWSAPDFRGPFVPHPGNPVLIDSAAARPAGRIVRRGGRLIRPVQDGRAGYGAALGLARIDRLDPEGFAQTVETILRPGPLWPGSRLHTLNRSAAFEFIDGSARAPRWR